MADGIGIIGSPQSAVTAPAGSVVSAQTAPPIDSAIAAADQSSADNTDPAAGISPRIVIDPFAGPITQFLDGAGHVQSQIPSTVVVAYLRAGLEANGQAKPQSPDGQAGTFA